MPGITGAATTYNLPNYVGELFGASPTDTPLLSTIGGLTGGQSVASTVFAWQGYDLRDADDTRQRLEGAAAPNGEERTRYQASNVLEIHQEAVEVTYTRQGATSQVTTDGAAGSSPLARGLHVPVEPVAPGDGIIPARAGFTARSGRRCRAGSDHPRSRGVYRRQAEEAAGTIGSSPLARGLLVGGAADVEQVGIIPARAGFTRSAASQSSRTRDHPRSRGVYDLAHPDLTGAAGSSPLARGLPVGEGKRVQAGRIIPARAGFTCCADHWRARDWDHPRSRGVYSSAMPREAVTVGSSPLARGLPDGPDRRARRLRIIPARAGFTRSSRTSTCGRSDHPRSRGVYCMARGVPHALAADHPRSRGVYHLVAPSVSVRNGSSPLARGLRGPAAPRLAAPGIIPARAGFTT